MNLLELRDIHLTYSLDGRPLKVLTRVDLSVARGEMIAILGPSGSGKSTLLYILGCLLKATGGSFHFAGHDVPSLSGERLADLRSREIGFVFQQFHLLSRADVLENVLLAARYLEGDSRSEDVLRAKALTLLESFGLSSHVDHKPNQLSGGQQQRVAIARALMNEPALILADEPTGNLDSKSADLVLDILRDIQASGRTVIIITHDREVARRCDRVVTIRDGVMLDEKPPERETGAPSGATGSTAGEALTWPALTPPVPSSKPDPSRNGDRFEPRFDFSAWRRYVPIAVQNLLRNKARSFLTMLGVSIGIAAVLSTITLGSFTRTKILETYEDLGVNKLVIRAYPRWNIKASEIRGAMFEGVSQEHDIVPMRRLFPEIKLISPVVRDWVKSVEFGGRTLDQASLLGVNDEYFAITNRRLLIGHPFTRYHSENHRGVCLIGYEIAKKLFTRVSPLQQMLQVNGQNDKQYSCLVIGVLMPQSSNSEWFNPNQQVLMPESFLSIMASRWNSKPNEFDMQVYPGTSLEELVTKVKQFFHKKYGRSAEVHVDSDQLLISQMRRFLNLFAVLLAAVAFISLAVGGIGITNMMLVSVAERFKEIGLRKALGARDREIRIQFLSESIILCAIAGFAGTLIGVIGYHATLYLAAQLFPKVKFEWVFNGPALLLSTACILVVGLASGLVPALRAEKLEVVEALRSE